MPEDFTLEILLEMSDKLTSQVIEMRLEYDEIFKRISNHIIWKNTKEGRKADLPKLEESHKEIMFASWDSRLKKAKKATVDAMVVANINTENINENLHGANVVAESIPGFLPDEK